MGKHIIPLSLKNHVIFKFTNYNGKSIKVYNTDKQVLLKRILDNYYVVTDMDNMLGAIERTRGTNKRSTDLFLDNLYWLDGICKYC